VRHELDVQIRWRDMDAYGHVNNAVYLTYLESCRDRWLEHLLGSMDETWNFMIRRVEIDYVSQLTLDDGTVRVEVELDRIGRTSITSREQIHAGSDGRLVAEAHAVLVHVDESRQRSAPIPDALRSRIEASATG